MARTHTCSNCIYWKAPESGHRAGTCRFTSPYVVPDGEGLWSGWPWTKAEDWCGDHGSEGMSVEEFQRAMLMQQKGGGEQ